MECCYSVDCGQYAVTPVLMAPCYAPKYCEDPPMCYPRLPRCPQRQIAYSCEQKTKSMSRTPPDQHHMENECNTCQNQRQRSSTPSRQCKRSPNPATHSSNTNCCQPQPNCCPTCYQPTCKPVKTKYVVPCYRYEDGRINQPTVLINRACEVALGGRTRRKPFVETSYRADSCNEIRKYHSEDEQGNCCYHFERKIPPCSSSPKRFYPCQACTPNPQCQYVDCVPAKAVDSPNCCFYC